MAKFTCNVISYILRRAVDITVIIPTPTIPEANRRAKAEEPCTHTPKEKYPVLYLLHGMGNNHATWTGYSNVELYAEEQRIAVVNFSAENKGYVTSGKDDFFRFVSEELPDFVCGIFPVSQRPEDTYIAGLSMGGLGTLIHGLNFPERFAAMGAFSSGFTLPTEATLKNPGSMRDMEYTIETLHGNPEVDPRFDPYTLASNLAKGQRIFPKIYMACGQEDILYRASKAFAEYLRSLGADVTWDELPEYGHEWRFWDIQVEKFLNWIPRTDYYAKLGRRRV